SAGPLPSRVDPMESRTKNLPFPMHGLTEFTVMFVPGEPSVGDAAKTSRVAGLRVVVVVVLAARDVLVTARVLDVDARVVVVLPVVPCVVVWACAAQVHERASTAPRKTPRT